MHAHFDINKHKNTHRTVKRQPFSTADVQFEADCLLQEEGRGRDGPSGPEDERDPQLHQVHQDVCLGQGLLPGCAQ